MEETDKIFGTTNAMGIIEQLAEIKHKEGMAEGHKEGMAEGHKEGVEAGLKEGVGEGLAKAARLLLAHTEYSPEKIAELVGVSLAVVEKERAELAKK